VSESREMQEVVISLPQKLMLEVEGIIQQEEINQDEFFHQAVKWYEGTETKADPRVDAAGIYGDGEDQFVHCFGSFPGGG